MAENTLMPLLEIKGFGEFQHYRDRRPPWIKFYAHVLNDAGILALPEAAQGQLFKLWLLASQLSHPLPNNPRLLAGKIGTTTRFYLPELIAAGFLIPCKPLATVEHSASKAASESLGSLTERESTEKETTLLPPARESDSVPPVKLGKTAGERTLALKLPTDSDRLALTAICAKVPSAASWVGECNAALEGMHGFQLSPAQLGEALRDYVGNGALNSPSLNHFRKYLQRAGRVNPPRPNGSTASVHDELSQWAEQSAKASDQ